MAFRDLNLIRDWFAEYTPGYDALSDAYQAARVQGLQRRAERARDRRASMAPAQLAEARSLDAEKQRQRREKDPERVRAAERAKYQRRKDAVLARQKERRAQPKVKERRREQRKAYNARPEVKERHRAYMRAWCCAKKAERRAAGEALNALFEPQSVRRAA